MPQRRIAWLACGAVCLAVAGACGGAYDDGAPASPDGGRADADLGDVNASVDATNDAGTSSGDTPLAPDGVLLRDGLPDARFTLDATHFYYVYRRTNDVGQETKGVARVPLETQGSEELAELNDEPDQLVSFGPYLYLGSSSLARVPVDDGFGKTPPTIVLTNIEPVLDDFLVIDDYLYVPTHDATGLAVRRISSAGVVVDPATKLTESIVDRWYAGTDRLYWLERTAPREFRYMGADGIVQGTGTFLPEGVSPSGDLMVQPFYFYEYSGATSFVRIDTSKPDASPEPIGPSALGVLRLVVGTAVYTVRSFAVGRSELVRVTASDLGHADHVAWLPDVVRALFSRPEGLFVVAEQANRATQLAVWKLPAL